MDRWYLEDGSRGMRELDIKRVWKPALSFFAPLTETSSKYIRMTDARTSKTRSHSPSNFVLLIFFS